MINDKSQMTKTMLFGRAWLRLGLLAVALVISACGTTSAVERPGPVTVAEVDDPTPVPPSATPTETTSPTATLRLHSEQVPTAADTPRPTLGASRTTPTPHPWGSDGSQLPPARFGRPDVDAGPIPGPAGDAFRVGHVVNVVPEDGIFHG